MKTFIIFSGLLLINVWALGYQGDMGRFTHAQTLLKAAAEECAAGAALFLDEQAYAEGHIEFDEAAGQAYAEAHLADTVEKIKDIQVNAYACHLTFGDRTVTVRLTLETADIFRLPFLSVTQLRRESTYEFNYI